MLRQQRQKSQRQRKQSQRQRKQSQRQQRQKSQRQRNLKRKQSQRQRNLKRKQSQRQWKLKRKQSQRQRKQSQRQRKQSQRQRKRSQSRSQRKLKRSQSRSQRRRRLRLSVLKRRTQRWLKKRLQRLLQERKRMVLTCLRQGVVVGLQAKAKATAKKINFIYYGNNNSCHLVAHAMGCAQSKSARVSSNHHAKYVDVKQAGFGRADEAEKGAEATCAEGSPHSADREHVAPDATDEIVVEPLCISDIHKLWNTFNSLENELWAVSIDHPHFPEPVYTMKIVPKKLHTNEEELKKWQEYVLTESVAAQDLQGIPGVLPVLCALQDSGNLYMILPFCPGMCLFTQHSQRWDNSYFHNAGPSTVPTETLQAIQYVKRTARPIFAFPLVRIPSDTHIRRRVFSITELIQILRSVSYSLLAVHQAGWMHRDIKPDNILVDKHGRLMLADFGVAFKGDVCTMKSGTKQYMPPENFLKGHRHDKSVDIYALGLVMCWLATGNFPYHMGTHDHAMVNALWEINSNLPISEEQRSAILIKHVGTTMRDYLVNYLHMKRPAECEDPLWWMLIDCIEDMTELHPALRLHDAESLVRHELFSNSDVEEGLPVFFLAVQRHRRRKSEVKRGLSSSECNKANTAVSIRSGRIKGWDFNSASSIYKQGGEQ